MEDDEEKLLQSVALQNANSIFLARQRAEHELVRTKEALEAQTAALAKALAVTEASLEERDRARAEADRARRVAQEANEAKRRFLNMISHELRTPLGAIGGYASLLVEEINGSLSAEQRKFITRIQHNQQHLLRLVNELLDLAKIESGNSPLNLSSVSVQRVLDSVYAMIDPQARASQIRLEVRGGDPSLSFYGDGDRVEQIVLNLLSNAVKFTSAGGSVTVTTIPSSDDIHLEVRDTGVGIPVEKLDAVFEPFFQVEEAPSGKPRGTGLGLAISRELARAMRGDLTVKSVLGEGSTFTLCLPREAATPATP